MKKFLLSLCVALLSCVAFAQNVVVVLKNGVEVKYAASDIDSIRIEKEEAEVSAPVSADKTGLEFEYDYTTMTATVVKASQNYAKIKIPARVFEPVQELVFDVTSIGVDAFYGCTNLTSIVIPNSVTTIEYGAFEGCTSLTSIEIPSSVTSIGIYAFNSCKSLTSIEIPNSVTSIEYGTFYSCKSLTSIEIPNSVTTIGYAAFEYCENLTSIEIPNSVTEIGDYAFADCKNLKTARVPKGCKVDNSTFRSTCKIEWY